MGVPSGGPLPLLLYPILPLSRLHMSSWTAAPVKGPGRTAEGLAGPREAVAGRDNGRTILDAGDCPSGSLPEAAPRGAQPPRGVCLRVSRGVEAPVSRMERPIMLTATVILLAMSAMGQGTSHQAAKSRQLPLRRCRLLCFGC